MTKAGFLHVPGESAHPACSRKQSALYLLRGEMRRDGYFLLALPAWFNEVCDLRFSARVGSY